MINASVGDKVLVTVDNWFYGADGKQYRAIFGTLNGVCTAEDTLGIKPNGKSTNWYIKVGNTTIAGCQVHYVLKTDTVNDDPVEDYNLHDGNYQISVRPSAIYMADL